MRLSRYAVIHMELGEQEDEAVRIAAESLKRDFRKVLTAHFVEELEADLCIRIRTGSPEGLSNGGDPDEAQGSALSFPEGYEVRLAGKELTISGRDRRGTIYGIYAVSRSVLGVSPWYFFGDVPVKEKAYVELADDFYQADHPDIPYRGIFINDEEELEHWAVNYMEEETIGVKTYEKIFELLLRLGLNYIWPAMHVNSFNRKKENGALADRMGIIVGTSHCDMLMRSNNREWYPWLKDKGYEGAKYDFSVPGRDREILTEYWRESVQQNKDFECSYTLGMRGIHDSGFNTEAFQGLTGEALREAKINLLETVIDTQEKLLSEELRDEQGQPRETLKLFVPYKEVLELYDNGLRVPEDLTLIWVNDNYGYVRRYPSGKEQARKGGNGLYYHNSYWAPPGGSYLFICSTPLSHTRNELRKAYEQGIRKLWVTNFGALKPLEMQMDFYAEYAWNAARKHPRTDDEEIFVREWIDENFSGGHGKELAPLLLEFDQLTNVRKIEQMDQDLFAQEGYCDEGVMRLARYEEMFLTGTAVWKSLPATEQDAFFQLVLMKIHAAFYTNAMYYYADRSNLCLKYHKDRNARECAAKYQAFDRARQSMLFYYNHVMANGKWNGILTPEDYPPPRTSIYPAAAIPLQDPQADADTGKWQADIGRPGRITLEAEDAKEFGEIRAYFRNEEKYPEIRGEEVPKEIRDRRQIQPEMGGGYAAAGFRLIPHLGRGKGCIAEAEESGQRLHYPFRLDTAGDVLLELHRFPTLNSVGTIQAKVWVDDQEAILLDSPSNDEYRGNWEWNFHNHVDKLYATLEGLAAGDHVLTIECLTRYYSFSRIVLYTGERLENNLGYGPEKTENNGGYGPETDLRPEKDPENGTTGMENFPGQGTVKDGCEGFLPDPAALYGQEACEYMPRPVLWRKHGGDLDNIYPSGYYALPDTEDEKVTPKMLLELGKHPVREAEGEIHVEAASALAGTEHAGILTGEWKYALSPAHQESDLALYPVYKTDELLKRPRERQMQAQGIKNRADEGKKPALFYRIEAAGGEYELWVRVLTWGKNTNSYTVEVDDGFRQEPRAVWTKDSDWGFFNEQAYVWVPVGKMHLAAGVHTVRFTAEKPQIRLEQMLFRKI